MQQIVSKFSRKTGFYLLVFCSICFCPTNSLADTAQNTDLSQSTSSINVTNLNNDINIERAQAELNLILSTKKFQPRENDQSALDQAVEQINKWIASILELLKSYFTKFSPDLDWLSIPDWIFELSDVLKLIIILALAYLFSKFLPTLISYLSPLLQVLRNRLFSWENVKDDTIAESSVSLETLLKKFKENRDFTALLEGLRLSWRKKLLVGSATITDREIINQQNNPKTAKETIVEFENLAFAEGKLNTDKIETLYKDYLEEASDNKEKI